MALHSLLLKVGLCGMLFMHTDPVFYQSDALKGLMLKPLTGDYFIQDDTNERVPVTALVDANGILYWQRKIKTPVCLTGECKLVDVGIYWHCSGDFLGVEVYGEHLTKTDHSVFSAADYEKLTTILSNDWSSLREYEFSDLIDEPDSSKVDGVSGATKKEIASEAVEDAVYTTYTLWHLIHQGEKEQLALLTVNRLNQSDLLENLLKSNQKRYDYFLLDVSRLGKLNKPEKLYPLLLKGLTANDDPTIKDLAMKALPTANLNDAMLQAELAKIYTSVAIDEKLEILQALKPVSQVGTALYDALAKDLNTDNEWFLAKLLTVLSHSSNQSDKVRQKAQMLVNNENTALKKAALELLNGKK
ncbi:FMN-binding protein [Tellurirhabdus bombi]|uniref:FMN-binding protein n=1 Tax=Tellurirhabdus bombi TaxID=2907205 RepID=UPI001F3F807F|nr:FMN-binding protein [Tellurirhabdus bombi]